MYREHKENCRLQMKIFPWHAWIRIKQRTCSLVPEYTVMFPGYNSTGHGVHEVVWPKVTFFCWERDFAFFSPEYQLWGWSLHTMAHLREVQMLIECSGPLYPYSRMVSLQLSEFYLILLFLPHALTLKSFFFLGRCPPESTECRTQMLSVEMPRASAQESRV